MNEQNNSHIAPYNIAIQTHLMGMDRVFLISGGQAHIGAIAVAYPTGQLIHQEVITIPGHREKELAAELAKLAASALQVTVTVIIGIHVDNATKEDIHLIISYVHHAMAQELQRIKALTEA